MYNIRQFKPVLYALLLVGLSGFSLAAQSPGLWVLGATGILLNAWLVFTGRFAPMPRMLANAVTLAATLYSARQMLTAAGPPVIAIGQFLVLLHLVKLWEQRANRDYAQLLILSLLLMVAAAINTASLLFGVLFAAYLFLSLFCCLLFHLKVETDTARAALALPEEKVPPARLRQDQRYLTRSMRRLTWLVSGVGVAMAVGVFLFFPRGSGANMLGPLQIRPAQALTGFSDEVGFQKIAQIQQNDQEMAYVEVWKNDEPVGGGHTLLLRGTVLDRYTGGEHSRRGRWQWIRSNLQFIPHHVSAGETVDFGVSPPPGADRWRQKISLRPTGTNALFALPGVASFTAPKRSTEIRYNRRESVLQTSTPQQQSQIDYEVVSYNSLESPSFEPRRRGGTGSAAGARTGAGPGPTTAPAPQTGPPPFAYSSTWLRARNEPSAIDPKIEQYARLPEVSGTDDDGRPLASLRPKGHTDPHPLDEEIARNIEQHLRTRFSYTLDLTDARKIIEGQDPLVAFLYDVKRGHCEYFAGAMTLMCQSLGMQARLVTGFKCDEFNEVGGYYLVRQSHAHAWVEVRTATGWKTFDPTSGNDVGRTQMTMWRRVKHLLNYLEFTYANNVIAYDNANQESLMASMETGMTNTVYQGAGWLAGVRQWLDSDKFDYITSHVVFFMMGLILLTLAGFVGWFLWEKWMLRRRAARIGLESLPRDEQLRLARQLGFYDDLLQLLARHQISRPRHLTPQEFSRSLTFLPASAFRTVQRLTDVFYRVRYGDAELSPGSRRRLGSILGRLGAELSRVLPARG